MKPPQPGEGLSVVVPVKDGAATIRRQLSAVTAGAGVPLEVVVADNGSTDGTADVVRDFAREHPGVRVVDASARPGVCFARNTGIAAATHEAIAVCDADDVVAPGWADAMASALQRHAYVGGPLEYDLLNPSWASAVRGRPMQDGLPDLASEGGPPWPYVIGANLGVRRSVHEAVGGFDEDLLTGDDNDYAYRLRLQQGVHPAWEPGAVVHYRLRADLTALRRQAQHYGRGLAGLVDRYAEHWPSPPRPRGSLERGARALARAALVRDRAGVGNWFWHLGWDAGYAEAVARLGTRPAPRAGAVT
ncbi:glycosyltransferase [Kineococcus indalonis]|uniref:glycosyltransferase n=1 Tax=Kineococcus indalonis TaxID=2696566 RepID=UPI001412F941|nr:glycosyltransferase [Kineococcus indalonis]NAZ85995.1 glycosyltransferase [Kineococcus indalonis]